MDMTDIPVSSADRARGEVQEEGRRKTA